MELFDRFCRGQDMIVRQLDGAVVFGNPSPEKEKKRPGRRAFSGLPAGFLKPSGVWWYFVGLKNG